jgi:CarboxypepD_reg-like domain
MQTEQFNKKNWGVQDFERYYSGNMAALEMHALEKAALDDPFLEDALEGYAYTKTPEADIAHLKNKLQPKKEEAKVIAYSQKKWPSPLLKIAAVLLLLAGLTWLLYPAEENKTVEIAAIKKMPQPQEKITNEAVADSQTVMPKTNANGVVSEASSPGATIDADSYKAKAEDKASPPAMAPTSLYEEDIARTDDLVSKESEMRDESKRRKQETSDGLAGRVPGVTISPANIIKGTVVDREGQPVAFANVKVPATNTNVSTDANGNFSLANQQNAATVAVNVNAVGYEQANTALNAAAAGTDNKIVLQGEKDKALNEVVVVGYGTSKKASRSSVVITTQKVKSAPGSNNTIVLVNAQPVDGWEFFNRSITEQLKRSGPVDTTGEVVLSFDIDDLGAANNIAVVKTLCDSCDAQAKRILQNAPPVRKIKRSKKVQAVLRF